MSLPILQTKLYVPKRERKTSIVPRPLLAQRLTLSLDGKVTLLSAPAGFGKSTLLRDWLAGLDEQASELPSIAPAHRVAWLTLESDDNDPVRFLAYLIAALRKLDPGIGVNAAPLLESPQPTAPKTILTILLNELSLPDEDESTGSPVYILVLEDYHVIAAQPIHEALTYLIDHAPPHMHVVITTRADPPLPFARWRARAQLVELRTADLRFSPEEAAAFLNNGMGLELTAEEVMALETRTEGWIAGLQLVALSLQGRANKADFVRTFSGNNRYVLTYLVEEVLNQQPRIIQRFLLYTSILERLCAPLCDAVVGDLLVEQDAPAAEIGGRSSELLQWIHRANIFLMPLDDEGRWHRYHQLFADVLQHRLHQTAPATLPLLHGRASVWFEQQGLLSDAVHHALRGEDMARAVDLIERSWPVLWNQGAVATLLAWVQMLPHAVLLAHPTLAISYAWALVLGSQMRLAGAWLHEVDATLHERATATDDVRAEPDEVHRTLLGRATALRAMMAARQGASASAVQLAQEALRLIPESATMLRGNACYALGLAYQQDGALDAALQAYQDATRLGVAADEHFLAIAARYHEGRIRMAQGQLRLSAATYEQLLVAASREDKSAPVVGLAHAGYAEILYQWNNLPAAALQIEAGLALSPNGALTYTDGPLHRFLTLARIRQSLGDRPGALAAVALARERAQQTGIALDVARAAGLAALIELRLGDVDAAARWLEEVLQLPAGGELFDYIHEFELSVCVRVLIARANTTRALSLLADWLAVAERGRRMGSVIEIGILQALAHQAEHQADAASHALVHSLTLAEPEGYIRLFVDEGHLLQGLLAGCRTCTGDPAIVRLHAYIDKLLAAFDEPPPPPSRVLAIEGDPDGAQPLMRSVPYPAIAALVEPLTPREVEVLRLVAAGFSNAAIAERLTVTVGTVKSHLKHIYGKLAVESRTQAVAQARTLGLL